MMIVMRRLVKVDHKVRTDINYPAGFMDVISVDKTGENYRLLFDTKGRFVLHRISAEEAKFKLLKVKKIAVGSKATCGKNPFHQGSASAVPYCVTHDGRTIRYPDPMVKRNDTVKFDITTGKIVDLIKFEVGNTAVITRGANAGRIGVITTIDKHPGAFDIVKLKDKRGTTFATRSENVFAIGEGSKPWISLPRGKGIKLSIIEEKEKLEKGTASKKKD
jgi:small subunit ribosomal protein S4e